MFTDCIRPCAPWNSGQVECVRVRSRRNGRHFKSVYFSLKTKPVNQFRVLTSVVQCGSERMASPEQCRSVKRPASPDSDEGSSSSRRSALRRRVARSPTSPSSTRSSASDSELKLFSPKKWEQTAVRAYSLNSTKHVGTVSHVSFTTGTWFFCCDRN